jgi:exonuclease SbcD
LLSGQGLHVRGTLSADIAPIVFHDGDGPVHVYALPYSEPSVVRQALNSTEEFDHHGAMAALTCKCREQHPSGCRSILVAHAFVTGGQVSESERPLSIGGAGTVDASCFEGFHYVALGHLHRPQQIKCNATPVHYSGSLLKYSFDEADHVKSVALVDMDGDGKCQMQAIPIRPRRDVRRVTAKFADLLASKIEGIGENDYLEVTLLDEGPIVGLMNRLREVFPNSAHARRAAEDYETKTCAGRLAHENQSELELFRTFYTHVAGKALEDGHEKVLKQIIDAMRHAERRA